MRPLGDLRVAHVIAGFGHEASGPSYSVPRLARAEATVGAAVELHALDWERSPTVEGVDVHIYSLFQTMRRLGLSATMPSGLRRAARRVDVVHSHGLWMVPNVLPWLATIGTRAALVVSPRGVFSEVALARNRTQKRVMWALAQGPAVRAAKLLHATSEAEAADMRRIGLRAPIAIVPNGVDLLAPPRARAPREGRRLLFLGRLHPIKGVDRLLRVWARLEPRFPDWALDIVGPDEGDCGVALRAQAAALALTRAHFHGPRFGADKAAAYHDADLFVLPTQSENFGMSVAESLSAGVPAVVSKGAPWSGLEAQGCGAWIELDDEALFAALARLMALPAEERAAMGARGRAWMTRDFGWEGIARKMLAAYAWVRGDATERPDWVHPR